MFFRSKGTLEHSELRMVVIKADGTRIDMGLVDAYYRNPFKMMWFNIKKAIKRVTKR